MTLETSYDNQKLIDKCTKDVDIISKEFKDNIKYIVRVSKDKQEEFKNNLDKKIKVNWSPLFFKYYLFFNPAKLNLEGLYILS